MIFFLYINIYNILFIKKQYSYKKNFYNYIFKFFYLIDFFIIFCFKNKLLYYISYMNKLLNYLIHYIYIIFKGLNKH